jgi:hypothetical protein
LRELARSEIVEKEQRPSTTDQNVIDAMIDEIFTDCVMTSNLRGDFEFCADPINA